MKLNRKTFSKITDSFSIYTLFICIGIILVIWSLTNTGESFKQIPADADANACLAVVQEFKKMVDENRAQYDKKVDEWEKKRNALQNEYNAGKNPASSPTFGGGGGGPFNYQCDGRGNYVNWIEGRGGSWMDQLTIRCKNGKTMRAGGFGGGPIRGHSCPGGFTSFDVWTGKFLDKIVAKCSSGGSFQGGHRMPRKGSFSCPPGTVLKGISGRQGSYIDQLRFHCGPMDYKPGNWPTLTSYYVGKTGDAKPVFKPIPVGQLPCQYCINKAANVDIDDSQKVKMIQSCANNIKQAEIADAEDKKREAEAAAKAMEEVTEGTDDKTGLREENEDTAMATKSEVQQKDGVTISSRIMMTGSFVCVCCLIAIIIVMGILLMRKK